VSKNVRIAIVAVLVAVIGLAVGAAWSGHRLGGRSDVRGLSEHRLDRLHAALRLTPEQEPAWKAFRSSVTTEVDRAARSVRSLRAAAPNATALDRLENGKRALAAGQGALDELLAATRTFYATLDKAQQARFDEAARRLAPGRFGHHRPIAAAA
jgi:hypothetical protein